MTHILLADDNLELCSALGLMLRTSLGIQMISQAHDMEHVLALVEDAPPECVILDWGLPGRPTRGRVTILRTLVPNLKVIALSARPESEPEAIAEEVDAFISKAEPPDRMIEFIRKVICVQSNG